ncbi:SNF2-related protein [Actinotignum sp. GS-2025c]|uniref:SNF2-related protein n=1 Tax=Actinotignum sp. GS-2025c TaxID=3427276 RepID=UPI003F47109B
MITSEEDITLTGIHEGMSAYHAKFYAHELARSFASDHVGKLAGLLFDAQVEPKPHQIDAALFALKNTTLSGVILADEVGLGKTIEAGIVICQYWAERKRRILIIAPSSLRQQWKQELGEKFALSAALVDRSNVNKLLGPNSTEQILICSYEFAMRHELKLSREWDLVVADEAHRLRSFWTGKTKTANAIATLMEQARKALLLTATPLQNRLEELFGLVSVCDPKFFGSLDAFRARYIDGSDEYGNDDLAERIRLIARRTLRKDANKYIRFTERIPLTLEFSPSADEQKLYSLVNDYLSREHLWAFEGSQRQLSALIIRKRLGSSTYAVASTLENIASRLEDEILSGKIEQKAIDPDITDEEAEAFTLAVGTHGLESSSAREAALAEVEELREYASLARSITVNQKAIALLGALDQGFAKLAEIGAPQKAIIFTDSTKTQEYLARMLREAGRGDGLILFNGQNTSRDANDIYQQWLEQNEGSDLITGVPAADRRKALVDEFRDRGTLMIATEAAAEGINLQFCSMLVNYDLPWNPQRVEQRIGRVHRFGQKFNVVVVNFSNKENLAEKRILQLLTEKFQLFTSVFGASDEILGSIEDGLDVEKSIGRILDKFKTAEEISRAFDELEAQYSHQINQEMEKARARVFDNLDPHVQDKLKSYDAQTGTVLNAFERLLLAVTRYQLADYAEFDQTTSGRRFILTTPPTANVKTGKYYFKDKPHSGAYQYRYNSPLGQWVIGAAKAAETPLAELFFSLSDSARVSATMKDLAGKNGLLVVNEATFALDTGINPNQEQYLLAAGLTDEGKELDEEDVRSLLDLAVSKIKPLNTLASTDSAHIELIKKRLAHQEEALHSDFENRTATFYFEQESLQDSRLKDLRAEYMARVRDFQAKEKKARKAAEKEQEMTGRLKYVKEARKWKAKAEAEEDAYRAARNKLQTQGEDYLTMIESALSGTIEHEHLFTIRWSIEA